MNIPNSESLEAPLSAIVGAKFDQIGEVLRLLRVDYDGAQVQEKRRGAPGEPLLDSDAANVEFQPLRAFIPDEVRFRCRAALRR
jgi:hypothetical protein